MGKRLRIGLVRGVDPNIGESEYGWLIDLMIERNIDAIILIYDGEANGEMTGWDNNKRAEILDNEIETVEANLNAPKDIQSIFFDIKSKIEGKTPCHILLNPNLSSDIKSALVEIFQKVLGLGLKEKMVTAISPVDPDHVPIPDLFKRTDDQIKNLLFAFALMPAVPTFGDIIHHCDKMKDVIQMSRLFASRDIPLLIEGETGTGKELIARTIHEASSRKGKPFVSVNCGAIAKDMFESEFFGHKIGAFTGAVRENEGKIKAADKGTLFLDEIGELPFDMQVKLLRTIEDKIVVKVGDDKETKVNFRVIAATNRNLMLEVAEGRFRQDLFYRLAVGYMNIPPIRKRNGDINLLIDYSIKTINDDETERDPSYKAKSLSVEARTFLNRQTWPGNFRELHFTMVRASLWFSSGSTIELKDVENAMLSIPSSLQENVLNRQIDGEFKIETLLDEVKQHYLKRAWTQSGKIKVAAAKLVGLESAQSFTKWCEKVGVNLDK